LSITAALHRSLYNAVMNLKRLLFTALLFICSLAAAQSRTMRLDYYHTGDADTEVFGMDRIVIEPLPWPGNPAQAIDDSNLGNYLFEVHDQKSDRLLYSRGFSSIYAEWKTTDEAKAMRRTFSESLRFPAPDAPAKVVLNERKEGVFREVWTANIDPKDMFIDSSRPPSPGELISLQKSGEPAKKVDLLIMADGYTISERSKFVKDARRLLDILFSTSPYKEHREDFNVWGLCPASAESGISRPSTGVHRRTPLGTSYDAFGSERYVLTFDNRALRDAASYAPYEFIEILVNGDTYGGGGIFNLYATVASDSMWSPYVFVHEFGHHFAGLADEYYTSDVAYNPSQKKIEPWESNVTALLDTKELKWRELVEPGTPLPTPWQKDQFENYEHAIQAQRRQIRAQNRPESEMNQLFQNEKQHEDALLANDKYAGKVGAFEGANYEAHGYYRPQENCIMFTRHDAFCAVCRRAIERIIAMYSSQ
jgi:IgA peptidase M64/peptidase M64-like protein